jgi:hypothetical protein
MTDVAPNDKALPLSGGPHVPVLMAILLAVACVSGLSFAYAAADPESTSLVKRLTGNWMCRVILTFGLAAAFYGMLELVGSRYDASGRRPAMPWLFGRGERGVSAENWRALNEQRIAPVGFAVFALPLLGFIGTVVGISGAIGELAGLFEGEDRTAALALVLLELRFAFDTTFAGLVGVLPVAFLGMLIRNAAADVEARLVRTD